MGDGLLQVLRPLPKRGLLHTVTKFNLQCCPQCRLLCAVNKAHCFLAHSDTSGHVAALSEPLQFGNQWLDFWWYRANTAVLRPLGKGGVNSLGARAAEEGSVVFQYTGNTFIFLLLKEHCYQALGLIGEQFGVLFQVGFALAPVWGTYPRLEVQSQYHFRVLLRCLLHHLLQHRHQFGVLLKQLAQFLLRLDGLQACQQVGGDVGRGVGLHPLGKGGVNPLGAGAAEEGVVFFQYTNGSVIICILLLQGVNDRIRSVGQQYILPLFKNTLALTRTIGVDEGQHRLNNLLFFWFHLDSSSFVAKMSFRLPHPHSSLNARRQPSLPAR